MEESSHHDGKFPVIVRNELSCLFVVGFGWGGFVVVVCFCWVFFWGGGAGGGGVCFGGFFFVCLFVCFVCFVLFFL